MQIPRVVLAIAVLAGLCLAATPAFASLLFQEIPPVPHVVEGQQDCLACHGLGAIVPYPSDHDGRENESCTLCHQPQEGLEFPVIPHPLEGREDCLACHGIGLVAPFPGDHEGRENEGCQVCHLAGSAVPEATPQPTATLPPSVNVLPTPIQEPVLFEENKCIACHRDLGGEQAQITDDWMESAHAERGVGCVSCHGGDPTLEDAAAAMSPEAGFLGPLPKERIPGLCGSCHSRLDLMRAYDLPTDQFDQYWQSKHGQGLLEGDTNVATCFDCHDGHRVLATSDPASRVYPLNEPAMCAGCHADEALMAAYEIPTNQSALYTKSIHGMTLLDQQDLRAPVCSTCHGTHGAAPPGFQEVANVCGRCHSITEDYYLEGAHRFGMTAELSPRCVTCHGRHDVPRATADLLLGTQAGHCGNCHPLGSETAGKADAIYQSLADARNLYEEAEDTISQASELRLIMAEQEEQLQQARTPLIEASALQHTVDVEQVQAKAESSMEYSRAALASAEAAIDELDTRRLGMIIALVVILITIVALVLIKLELDRDLETRRAQSRGEPT